MNGWTYIMMDAQHPYGESDQDQVRAGLAASVTWRIPLVHAWKAQDFFDAQAKMDLIKHESLQC